MSLICNNSWNALRTLFSDLRSYISVEPCGEKEYIASADPECFVTGVQL